MAPAGSVRGTAGVVCVAAFTTLAGCGSEVVASSGGAAGSASTTSSTTSTTSTSSSTGNGGSCAAPTSAISSLEAVTLARCVIPGGEQARLLGYAALAGYDPLAESTITAPGTYARWELEFQDDETTYVVAVGIDFLVFFPSALPQPECTPPSVPTLDSTVIVPAAMEALEAPEDYPPGLFMYRHALSCLKWGAEGYAVVSIDWSWKGGDEWSSYHAVFSPDGELLLVCGPCYTLNWTSCCEPP